MKGDLISRVEAVEMLMEKADCYAYKEAAGIAIGCAGAVKNLPAVDAEPVRHGRWGAATIIGYNGLHPIYARPCSECKYEIECRFERNYCPHCGAKMDGGVNE